MPALNFKRDFVDAIQRGEKRQTIRQVRNRQIRPGDKLALYTGMRTAQCWKIGDAICEDVRPIQITEREMMLAGRPLETLEQMDMARADGFSSHIDMRLFFKRLYGLPFTGVVIRFRLTSVAPDRAGGSTGEDESSTRAAGEHDG